MRRSRHDREGGDGADVIHDPGAALARVEVRPLAPHSPGQRLYLPPDATIEQGIAVFLPWIKYVRRLSDHTVAAYGFDLRHFLTFTKGIGVTRPAEVTVRDIEMFMVWLQETRRSAPATVNRVLHCLRTFYRFLEREDVVVKNPAARAQTIRTVRRVPDYLSPAQQEQVLVELARDRSLRGRRDFAMIATDMLSGLRAQELTNLRLDQLDLDGGRLRVLGKGSKQRELPILPRLASILREYLTEVRPALVQGVPSPYVFVIVPEGPGKGRPGRALNTRYLRMIIARRVAPLVGRRVWPHMLRHSYASRLRSKGADLGLIQEALGHSSLSTTMMYAHLATEERLEKLTKYLA